MPHYESLDRCQSAIVIIAFVSHVVMYFSSRWPLLIHTLLNVYKGVSIEGEKKKKKLLGTYICQTSSTCSDRSLPSWSVAEGWKTWDGTATGPEPNTQLRLRIVGVIFLSEADPK